MALTDLTAMDLPGETITLPIGGRDVVFHSPPAWFARATSRAATTGTPEFDKELLPDDRDADEYRHLLGEHFDEMRQLSQPRWAHLTTVLTAWVIFGNEVAERLWERQSPEAKAPAGSSDGARAKTASTSGTSTKTARRSPRKAAARESAGARSGRTKT